MVRWLALALLVVLPGCFGPAGTPSQAIGDETGATGDETGTAPGGLPTEFPPEGLDETGPWSPRFHPSETPFQPSGSDILVPWTPTPCDGSGATQRSVAAPVAAALQGDNWTVARAILAPLGDEALRLDSSTSADTWFVTRFGTLGLNLGIVTYQAQGTVFGHDGASMKADFERYVRDLGLRPETMALRQPPWGGQQVVVSPPGCPAEPYGGWPSASLGQSLRGNNTSFQLVGLRDFRAASFLGREAANATARDFGSCRHGAVEVTSIEAQTSADSLVYLVGIASLDQRGPCWSPWGHVVVDAVTGAVLQDDWTDVAPGYTCAPPPPKP